MNATLKLLIGFVLLILISGCTQTINDFEVPTVDNGSNGANDDDGAELDSTLTAARNLNDVWVGTFTSQENSTDVDCLYSGAIKLTLQGQQGNSTQGVMVLSELEVEENYNSSIPIPCGVPVAPRSVTDDVTGTISSSSVSFDIRGKQILSGSFITDSMELKVTDCLISPSSRCESENGPKATVFLFRQ